MYPWKKAQINHLKADDTFIKVFKKFANFANIFLARLTIELPKHTSINNYAIKLVNDQQLLYRHIYYISLVELESLMVYIKNNLANGFIRLSKSLTGASILLDKKLDKGLRLCINYQVLNNLIIKNKYLLLLIRKLLNQNSRKWKMKDGFTNSLWLFWKLDNVF